MDNMFTPTLDWGNELLTSLWWIAKAWVIAAVATMVILWLIHRFTTWGRQFWRITGDYFTGPDSVKVWIWLAVLLLSVVTGVRIDVLLSYQGNDMMTSFQVSRRGPRQWRQRREKFGQRRLLVLDRGFRHLGHHPRRARHAGFVPDAAVHAAMARLAHRSAHRRLAGRQGLLPGTLHRRHDRQSRSAYSTGRRHLHGRRRAPAQHAQQHLGGDAAVRCGLLDYVDDFLHRDPVESLGHPHTAHRRGRAFRGRCSGSGWSTCSSPPSSRSGSAGRSSGCPSTTRSSTPRSATRWCACATPSEAVAFYRGELAERTGLRRLFAPVVSNYKRYLNRMIGFYGWNLSMSQIIVLPPYILQFPRFPRRRDQARRHDPVRVGIRQHPGRPVVLPQRLRPVRRLPGRDHPSARPGRRQRRRQGAAGSDDPCHVSTARFSSTTSRSAPPTESSSSSRSTCAWKSVTRWW